jgi:hypothetical protein
VQDQVSGQVVATGPKVGFLFPLQSFSIPRSVSWVVLLFLVLVIFGIRN